MTDEAKPISAEELAALSKGLKAVIIKQQNLELSGEAAQELLRQIASAFQLDCVAAIVAAIDRNTEATKKVHGILIAIEMNTRPGGVT